MNQLQKKRLMIILSVLCLLGLAMGFLLFALRQNINLFYTPKTAIEANLTNKQVIRVGGWVEPHSVKYTQSGKQVIFLITDKKRSLIVNYAGVLPTLFREGQGVVITGTLLSKNKFIASQVLAKHDEKYRPPILRNIHAT